MYQMKRKLINMIVSGALLVSLGAVAFAQDSMINVIQPYSETIQNGEEIPVLPASVLYYGNVSEILRDDDGTITGLRMDSERYGEYVMKVSDMTVWIDSGEQTASDPSTLEEGESVYIFHSSAASLSLPPQSSAIAIVRNIPQDAGSAMYHVVESVTAAEDGSISIVTDNGGLIITADQETLLRTYLTKDVYSLDDISEGTRIMAWYSAVAESYPAQTNASAVMILPGESDTKSEVLEEGQRITMSLDGKVPNMVGRYENGTVMVPVAAVARAMGFEAYYTVDENGQTVSVESDTFAVRMNIEKETIFGVTKIEGAVGMTAPVKYDKMPYIVEPGTTWAPAEIFEMLGKSVTLDGTNLIIE